MKRSSKELKHQLGDFWSNRKHGGDSFEFFEDAARKVARHALSSPLRWQLRMRSISDRSIINGVGARDKPSFWRTAGAPFFALDKCAPIASIAPHGCYTAGALLELREQKKPEELSSAARNIFLWRCLHARRKANIALRPFGIEDVLS
jgi:hypothetical protein